MIKPAVTFPFEIDEEITMKGYVANVEVQLPDHSKYKLIFYDIARLSQDLKDESYIGEVGLIVVEEMTKENIERVVYQLWLDGYFEKMIPL